MRSHAVIALCQLIGSEDPDDFDCGEQSISEVVLDSLCLDSAASVVQIFLASSFLLRSNNTPVKSAEQLSSISLSLL